MKIVILEMYAIPKPKVVPLDFALTPILIVTLKSFAMGLPENVSKHLGSIAKNVRSIRIAVEMAMFVCIGGYNETFVESLVSRMTIVRLDLRVRIGMIPKLDKLYANVQPIVGCM